MAFGFLRKLFGAGTGTDDATAPAADEVEYQGYRIRPAPKAQGGQYLTAGLIRKQFPDGEREQLFIRADTHASRDDAVQHAIRKAQQLIDEQGDKLFRDQQKPV